MRIRIKAPGRKSRNTGNPPGRPPIAPEERFWAKVKKSENCWEWQGGIQEDGYGRIRSDVPQEQVHRYSWKLHNGPIPDGVLVLHECDNRKCVRPDHLFLGTHKDNTQDMIRKGRKADVSGTKNGMWGKKPHNRSY